MLTGHRDRATDLAAMEAGATDFLLKGRTDSAALDRTLRYAISNVAMVSTLDRSRSQMAGLEEIGLILVQDGPMPATVERVLDLIVECFALPRIAVRAVAKRDARIQSEPQLARGARRFRAPSRSHFGWGRATATPPAGPTGRARARDNDPC